MTHLGMAVRSIGPLTYARFNGTGHDSSCGVYNEFVSFHPPSSISFRFPFGLCLPRWIDFTLFID
jgi:hypothetical protein